MIVIRLFVILVKVVIYAKIKNLGGKVYTAHVGTHCPTYPIIGFITKKC
jgi:hypothetical protein